MESVIADALTGRMLDGRYHVRSRIAHGGMATVYLATDTRLDRQVALKVMHAELARDEEFVSRFIGEAKSVARLSHPNIVAVFDQGSDGQFLYLAMEYVPGRTLRSLLRERGPFSPGAALNIMDPILSALAAAHEAGIVHRDAKPENVLLTADGRVKVVDFGLARAQAASGQTRAGLVIGTVAYIAPEQVTGHVTDFRTDVYAAGVMLFELLTGRQPHTGDSPLQVAYKHVNFDVPPPSAWVPGIPPAMDTLVRAATSRDPRLRPADAGALLGVVRAVRGGADPDAALRAAAGPAVSPPPARPAPGAPYDPPGPAADGDSSHTMVVAGGYPGYDTPPPRGPGLLAGLASPLAGGMASRAGGRGHHAGADEPFLTRWLFSKRLAYVAVALVAALGVVTGGWWLTSGQYTPLPSVTGLPQSQAAAMLKAHGFAVRLGTRVHDDTYPAGDVIGTSPSGRASSGATITLTVSSGPRVIKVPPIGGKSFADAVATLRAAGLTVSDQPQNVGQQGAQIGSVAGTNPPAGTLWPAAKTVYVEVVTGPPVPNLVGQNEQAVQQNWAQPNGVTLNVQQDTASTQPQGIITRQDPAPDSPMPAGQTVTVWVSNGPPMVPVPNVQGEDIDKAVQDLRNAGFNVDKHQVGPTNRVIFYRPIGSAPQGSTIQVYYGF
jgi:eukaryotic-like serine/threonine-protein kinase